MARRKVEVKNRKGETLAGALELPDGRAEADIGGRNFTIGADLLDDLEQWPVEKIL